MWDDLGLRGKKIVMYRVGSPSASRVGGAARTEAPACKVGSHDILRGRPCCSQCGRA